jgi:hypothetical protein
MKLIKKITLGLFYFALLYAFHLGIGFEYSTILGLSLILSNQNNE